MKGLGDLHYLLGVHAICTSKDLFLCQKKYVINLLLKFHLHKPVRTPLPSRTTLLLIDGDLLTDLIEYCSMVGALQYLTMARYDITYDVHLVFQFIANSVEDLLVVKRIYKYLQGTSDRFMASPLQDNVYHDCILEC